MIMLLIFVSLHLKQIFIFEPKHMHICSTSEFVPCYVGSCHHSMVCPWVANVGDNLKIWRVAVNILDKQSWTGNKG